MHIRLLCAEVRRTPVQMVLQRFGTRACRRRGVQVLVCLALWGALAARAHAADPAFEAAPLRHAAELLGTAERQGEGFTVRDRVSTGGFFDHYELETRYGLYRVTCRALLAVRVHEVATMIRLEQMNAGNELMSSLVTAQGV